MVPPPPLDIMNTLQESTRAIESLPRSSDELDSLIGAATDLLRKLSRLRSLAASPLHLLPDLRLLTDLCDEEAVYLALTCSQLRDAVRAKTDSIRTKFPSTEAQAALLPACACAGTQQQLLLQATRFGRVDVLDWVTSAGPTTPLFTPLFPEHLEMPMFHLAALGSHLRVLDWLTRRSQGVLERVLNARTWEGSRALCTAFAAKLFPQDASPDLAGYSIAARAAACQISEQSLRIWVNQFMVESFAYSTTDDEHILATEQRGDASWQEALPFVECYFPAEGDPTLIEDVGVGAARYALIRVLAQVFSSTWGRSSLTGSYWQEREDELVRAVRLCDAFPVTPESPEVHTDLSRFVECMIQAAYHPPRGAGHDGAFGSQRRARQQRVLRHGGVGVPAQHHRRVAAGRA